MKGTRARAQASPESVILVRLFPPESVTVLRFASQHWREIMGRPSPETQAKRRREQAKREKREEKERKRAMRKAQKAGATSAVATPESPDLESNAALTDSNRD